MKGKRFVATGAQNPVVLKRVEEAGDSGRMRQIAFDQCNLVVVLADGELEDVALLEADEETARPGMVEQGCWVCVGVVANTWPVFARFSLQPNSD